MARVAEDYAGLRSASASASATSAAFGPRSALRVEVDALFAKPERGR